MSDPINTKQSVDWLTIIAPIVTFVLGFISAVFAEPIRQRIFRPVLNLSFTQDPDCITETPTHSPGQPHASAAYYIRVRVVNQKPRIANKCRAYLTNVEIKNTDGKFEPSIYTDSIQLAWSCQKEGKARDPLDLANGVTQYIDVISTNSIDDTYRPEIAPFPYRYNTIFNRAPKVLRLNVQVSGDNVEPKFIKIVFNWKGNWDNFEAYRA